MKKNAEDFASRQDWNMVADYIEKVYKDISSAKTTLVKRAGFMREDFG